VKRDGFELVVAAGGDGTVSAVAGGLVGTGSALAIIPLGTTNVLARELGVPLDLDAACGLAVGPNSIARIDAMKVGSSYYFTQIGVGIDALMIHDTSEVDKRRMGAFAYVRSWLKSLVGATPRRITVTADGLSVESRTLQVILANCGALGVSGLRWGPDVRPDDGLLDVCIFRPRTPLDYLRIAWHFVRGQHRGEPRLTYLRASRTVTVQAAEPLPVQGDGEVLSQTPLAVEIVPNAIRVVVPPRGAGLAPSPKP
jgi:YegS/Rv2252/BmrU family lipid kinase